MPRAAAAVSTTASATAASGAAIRAGGRAGTATAAAIELLREQSLATLAQQDLERRIISGEIAAGAKLNEVDVAAMLGVSRGPVREAFRALGQAGLVRVAKNRGVFVREVSLEEASEFYEVRAALEGLIGRLAARRIAADEVEQLRAIVRRMQALDKSRRADAYFALNVGFHDVLARSARNNALLANYRGVVNQLDLYRRATIARSTENMPLSTREHAAIVAAVAARDEALAERLLAEHVLRSRARLQEALRLAAPAG
ncbi:MAG: FCD domain-containing protein [Rubrivivax sp.]|nr:FCD domain-containing protein [Rubrivivax sp.]